MEKPEYTNLTELLLNIVRQRPGMYLGTKQITKIENFILGYRFRDSLSHKVQDFYFGDSGFIEWYTKKYNLPQLSSWENYFLDEAKDDEVKALEIYFARLEEYYNWYKIEFSIQTFK